MCSILYTIGQRVKLRLAADENSGARRRYTPIKKPVISSENGRAAQIANENLVSQRTKVLWLANENLVSQRTKVLWETKFSARRRYTPIKKHVMSSESGRTAQLAN